MKYLLLIPLLAFATPALAQSRADQLALEFSKKKDKAKTKKGVTTHTFFEAVAQPWRLPHVQEYAGHYASDEFTMDIAVAANGSVTASGVDDRGAFQIRNARIRDAVLTGRKTRGNGRTEAFEAAFLKRSERSAPDEPFTASYGIGYSREMDNTSRTIVHHFLARR